MPKTSTKKYTYALGRRKSSVATVKLFNGKGDMIVNNKPIDVYFPAGRHIQSILKPFVVTESQDKYNFIAKVIGGGKRGQSDALKLAISRAIDKKDSSLHPLLKKEDLLTVDSRVRERRKVGTGGKARRQKQSPKR